MEVKDKSTDRLTLTFFLGIASAEFRSSTGPWVFLNPLASRAEQMFVARARVSTLARLRKSSRWAAAKAQTASFTSPFAAGVAAVF
jgi:hypothetical protein